MIPRGVLDIDWPTLLMTAVRCLRSPVDTEEICKRIEQVWDTERSVLVCLSVRSGLDAVLTALNWPVGSEVLISAATIPDMVRVLQEHGLVPVPVDVDPNSLAPDIEQIKSRCTPRTRAILVAHLFGSRLELSEMSMVARERGISLWEDVAQGFAADVTPGDPLADISFFSFGMIKTQTALGGGVLRFRDPALALECRSVQSAWPQQPMREFRKKLYRSMVLRLLSQHFVFTIVVATASCLRMDLDEWIGLSVRGFDQCKFLHQLRHRPSGGLVELLLDRLVRLKRRWLEQKNDLAEQYCRLLPSKLVLGSDASFPTRWVLAIVSRDPKQLVDRLKKRGYDATVRASQIRVVPVPVSYPEWTTPQAETWVSRLVFLPLHPALRPWHITEIASTVIEFES